MSDDELTPEEESALDTLALALAVVKPGGAARLLNADNSADPAGWVSIEDAVASGRAFFIELKDSLAAFDLDSADLVEAGQALRAWAQSEGLPALVVSSGRAGHQHLYVRGEGRNRIEAKALSLGIGKSAHRRMIRPPLAPHRNGLETTLLSPQTVDEALEVLGPSAHGEQRRKNLPEWLITLINDGDVQGRYGGRSQMALAIASGLRSAGYDFADYRAVMANRTNLGGAKYHALEDGEGTEDPETFLSRTWEKASNQLTPSEILEQISQVREAVQAAAWTGRTATTDRAVMLALCELGTASGTTALTFGSRRIAEVAQVEDRTVRKALGRLIDAGWLEQLKAVKVGDADTYRFVDKMTASRPSPHRGKCGNSDQIDGDRVLLHPVFRNGSGLGKSTGRTWLKLQELDRPATVKELVEAGAGQRRTVDRHMKKLESHGLAVKSGGRWTASGEGQRLDELAVELGAVERSAMQAERYERNRNGFRELIRQKQAGHQPAPTDDEEHLDRLIEDHERECWEQEQWMLREAGLPNELP